MGWQVVLYGRIYVDFSFLTVHKVCTKARLLGERSVRIREVKGSNPSRSTFSSSVILTLLLFFCIHISHALALGPRGIRTARPCRRQGKQPAQCNGDDRSQWLKQGGAVGAAFGFFKALPRGCGKISKRNPYRRQPSDSVKVPNA